LSEELTESPPSRGLPISWLLPLTLAGLVLLALGPVLVLGYPGARDNTSRLLRDRTELTLKAVVEPLVTELHRVREQLAYIADAVRAGDLDADDPAAIRDFVIGALAATPPVFGIAHIRPDLMATRYNRMDREALSEDWRDFPPELEAIEEARVTREPRWVGPVWSPAVLEPIITVRQPLHASQGFRGTLVAAIGLKELSGMLAAVGVETRSTPFVLIGRERVLAHPRLGGGGIWTRPADGSVLPKLDEIGDLTLAAIWDEPRELGSLASFRNAQGHWISGPEDYTVFVYRAVAGYGDQPWLVGTYFPSAASQRERWIVIAIGLAGLLLLAMALFAALRLARRLGRPVLALAEAARGIERMDFAAAGGLSLGLVREDNEAMNAFERMGTALRWFETYLPKALVRRLMASGADVGVGEERELTIMFTDLADYTAFSRGRHAAEVAGYLNELLARVGPLIEASGGTIDKYIGDSVMAFWGAPEPQDDHADRALRAAREIAVAITSLNAERRVRGLATCRLRIGIHTGPVIVGNVGFPGRVDYTVIGEAVNVAQRLEQAGREHIGTAEAVILVSAGTRDALTDPTLAVSLNPAAGIEPRAWRVDGNGDPAEPPVSPGASSVASP